MKLKVILAVFTMIGSTSYGSINVAWSAAGGFYASDANVGILDEVGSALAQLIYAPVSAASEANTAFGPGLVDTSAGYAVLSSFIMTSPGTTASEYGDFSISVQEFSGYSAGYVYARIFETATPVVGTWFYQSPIIEASLYNPNAPLVTSLQINRDLINGDQVFADAPNNFQVVPEPSVMALLGLGGLMMAIRRQRMAA